MEVTQALLRTLDVELQRGVGLDLQWYDVLLHVREGGDGLRMTELAEAVVLSKSGLTSLVDRMEASGLIQRQPDPVDRRATRVVLSQEGERRYREGAALHRKVVRRIFTSLVSDHEAAVILETLERVRQELGQYDTAGTDGGGSG